MCEAPSPLDLLPPATEQEQLAMSFRHPVALRQYSLPTPPLKEAADQAFMRVMRRQAFCPFIGDPRFGKTCALNYIFSELQETAPTALVVKVVAACLRSRTPSSFHDYLFSTFGGQVEPGRPKSHQSLLRAAHRLLIQAHDAQADQVVLLVDEFGRLTVDELTYLADLSNVLMEHRIRTTTVAFGSCEMESLLSALQLSGRRDLIGRFLSGIMSFKGISSAEQLGEVMHAYDDPEIAEYPPGSGWSLTRFFWPTAWTAGHRLAHFHKDAWRAFSATAGHSKMQIGAEYWSSAIEHALTTTMSFHLPTAPVNFEIWKDAVHQSGFVDTLNMSQLPERRTSSRRNQNSDSETEGDESP
ncbi:MAG: ATP-binding protein [Pseudomonadota bacterium]